MSTIHMRLTIPFLLLLVTAAHAGPAEVHALEEQLADVDARIAETEAQLKEALSGFGSNAGEYGITLRALKRERAQTAYELQKATADQRKREISIGAGPLSHGGPDRGRRREAPK